MNKHWGILTAILMTSMGVEASMADAMLNFDSGNYVSAGQEFSRLVAEDGNAQAALYLGRMYAEGLGGPIDGEKAALYFKFADEKHEAEAATYLGKMLVFGIGVQANVDKGLDYLKKGARGGSAAAFTALGDIYLDGKVVPRELNYAFGFYLLGALKGDKKAQFQVGRMYMEGAGTPQDFTHGRTWLGRSANQGYVVAQIKLAEMYAGPNSANAGEAYYWYNIVAAYNADSVGTVARTKRDELAKSGRIQELGEWQRRSREWRPIAADKSVPHQEVATTPAPIIPGFNDERTVRALMREQNTLTADGTPYNINQEMIEKAVTTGNRTELEQAVDMAAKQGKNGVYAFYGDVLSSRLDDKPAAFEWYKRGAQKHEGYAQYQLSKMYCAGDGMEYPDIGACYGWLLAAQSAGLTQLSATIDEAITLVKKNATAEELSEGERLSAEYTGKSRSKAVSSSGVGSLF